MANTTSPVAAVAAWIDGRLDLAFDEKASPAYSAIREPLIEPLIEQLQRGVELGVFKDIVPAAAAKSIHGVVWAGTRRQRATDHRDRDWAWRPKRSNNSPRATHPRGLRRVACRAPTNQPRQLGADRHDPLPAALAMHNQLRGPVGDEHVTRMHLSDLSSSQAALGRQPRAICRNWSRRSLRVASRWPSAAITWR
jgi:hypothetical protein